jgi:hypothetical protein
MKILASLLACCLASSLHAQTFSDTSKFAFKITKSIKADSVYTKEIASGQPFIVQIDSLGLSKDSMTLIQTQLVFEKTKALAKDIKNWNSTYSLAEGEYLVYVFNVIKKVVKKDTSTAQKPVSAKVNLVDSNFQFQLKIERPKPAPPAQNPVSKTIEDLFNKGSVEKPIGIFELKGIASREFEISKNRKFVIDSVAVVYDHGVILKNGLMVKGRVKDSPDSILYFRNLNAAISLARLSRYNNYMLMRTDGDTCDKLRFSQVLSYEPIGKFYYPDGGSVGLTKSKRSATISNATSATDVVNMSIFTDLLALVGRRANGVVQAELDAKFITNTVSRRNVLKANSKNRSSKFDSTDCKLEKKEKKDGTWWAFVNPYFALAKFDSKFQRFDSATGVIDTVSKNKYKVDRLYANRIAYLRAGTRVNLYTKNLWPNEQFQFNFGAELTLTNADSLIGKDLVNIMYYPEFVYKVNKMENFGFEASLRYLLQFTSKNAKIDNDKAVSFLNPQFVLYYYPFSNPESRIYLRYAHFAQLGGSGNNTNYPLFQFGYKTNLFKKKE